MKINTSLNIDINSEISELIFDKGFLKIVDRFISIYGLDEHIDDLDVTNFFMKLEKLDYSKDMKTIFTYNELLNNLGYIFDNEVTLSEFLIYINQIGVNQSILNIYLEVAEYLLSIYSNKGSYLKELGIEENRMKDEIGNILGKNEIKNISLKLVQNNFPVISSYGFPIIEADFDNMINFYGDNDINFLYLKIKDMEGNMSYINYKGDILLTNDGREIIDIEYIYYFKEFSVLKTKCRGLKTSIEIISKNGNTFDMPVGLSDILPGKLIDGDNELEYLILAKSIDGFSRTTMFNEEGDTINALDILRFVNKGKFEVINNLELTLSKFESIDLTFNKLS